MSYLLLTTSFGLGIDQIPLTLHKNCSCAFAVLGVMLLAISMCVVGVGL